MQSVHTLLKLAHLRLAGYVTRMPDGRLPKKLSMKNFRKESAHKLVKRNATKTSLKPRFRTSVFHLRVEQSGIASSTKEPHSLKQRESVKLKGSAEYGKQEPIDHHQTRRSPRSHALFATDSLELMPNLHLACDGLRRPYDA